MNARQDAAGNKVNEFKLARQLTRHSPSEVAKALGVERSTVSRWESGQREAPQDVVEWLQINRNAYPSNPRPLTRWEKDAEGNRGARGEDLRSQRAIVLMPQVGRALDALK